LGLAGTPFKTLIAIFSNLVPAIRDVIAVLVQTFINMSGSIIRVFAGIASAIVNPFIVAFRAIAGLWNATVGKLHFSIPKWVPGVGGKGFDVPNIPMLAEGGIVNRPTLAMIGEAGPEAVVPLNKGGLGGVTIQINAGALMGSDVEARKFALTIVNHMKDIAGAKNMTVSQLLGS
jgi:phage-related minor tail protein